MTSTIYTADTLVTMNGSNDVLSNSALLVEQGVIADIGSENALMARNPQVEIVRLTNCLLMPGLINTHCHSGLLRGTAEGLPVWDWLQQYIDPMHRVLLPEEAALASRLCYSEALLSGTTTIVDMWRYMDGSAAAAKELGIRAILVPYVAEHPDHDYFETLDSNETLIKEWQGEAGGRINVWVGLEHLFYAEPSALNRINDLCRDYQVGFHTHSNESRFDVEKTLERYSARPIEVLENIGLLDAPHTLLAHCVWLDDREIEILSEHGVGVAHNPISNMKLASGAARITDMLAQNIAVGLGTDGEKENNNLDMFEEMKSASLLAKLKAENAAERDAWDVCRMATINGARALGIDDEVGSLEVGKKADIIAVRNNTPRMTPFIGSGKYMNLHHNLVHAVQGGDVVMTMIDGKVLVAGGQLQTANLADIVDEATQAIQPLLERRDQWIESSGLAVNELDQ
jgi:5-methylthioadenosine/S-adenosylhomocysteine deaminase